MPPECPSRRPLVGQTAFAVWAVILLIISCRSALWPNTHTVYPIFARAGHDWRSGNDLFAEPARPGMDVYRYSPFAAATFVPFSLLPDALGGVLWRLAGFALFLGGFAWWARRVLPDGDRFSSTQRAALWLLLVPLSLHSLNNGQANVHVIGLLLVAVAAAAERRWNLAAVCLAVACWFKIYPIAIGLLLVVVYPRALAWRLLLALGAAGLAPFLLQHPAYVAQMYDGWFAHLSSDGHRWHAIASSYRDLWLLCRLWCPISVEAYVGLQLATAAGLAMCFVSRRPECCERRLLTLLTVLGTGWMMLCGPATETCTYIMVAPALAWVAVDAWSGSRSVWTRAAVAGIFLLFVARPALAQVAGTRELSFALQPLATLLLMLLVLATQIAELFQSSRLPSNVTMSYKGGVRGVSDLHRDCTEMQSQFADSVYGNAMEPVSASVCNATTLS